MERIIRREDHRKAEQTGIHWANPDSERTICTCEEPDKHIK